MLFFPGIEAALIYLKLWNHSFLIGFLQSRKILGMRLKKTQKKQYLYLFFHNLINVQITWFHFPNKLSFIYSSEICCVILYICYIYVISATSFKKVSTSLQLHFLEYPYMWTITDGSGNRCSTRLKEIFPRTRCNFCKFYLLELQTWTQSDLSLFCYEASLISKKEKSRPGFEVAWAIYLTNEQVFPVYQQHPGYKSD